MLYFWDVCLYGRLVTITAFQCTYDSVVSTEEKIKLFDPYTGDSEKAPRYSFEYLTRTDDHISAVVTQTEYDGIITTKTVDIRVENDELKVEIK